jgi:hypothetical protein
MVFNKIPGQLRTGTSIITVQYFLDLHKYNRALVIIRNLRLKIAEFKIPVRYALQESDIVGTYPFCMQFCWATKGSPEVVNLSLVKYPSVYKLCRKRKTSTACLLLKAALLFMIRVLHPRQRGIRDKN